MTIRKTLRPQKPHETRFTIRQPKHYPASTQTKAKCGRYTQRRKKTKKKTYNEDDTKTAHICTPAIILFSIPLTMWYGLVYFTAFFFLLLLLLVCCTVLDPYERNIAWKHFKILLYDHNYELQPKKKKKWRTATTFTVVCVCAAFISHIHILTYILIKSKVNCIICIWTMA